MLDEPPLMVSREAGMAGGMLAGARELCSAAGGERQWLGRLMLASLRPLRKIPLALEERFVVWEG